MLLMCMSHCGFLSITMYFSVYSSLCLYGCFYVCTFLAIFLYKSVSLYACFLCTCASETVCICARMHV
jgi:hypothetical protein